MRPATLASKARSGFIHLERWYESRVLYRRLRRIRAEIEAYERRSEARGRPVVFFNASTRLGRLSQNAAFSLLASWGLRLGGVPVVYFVCDYGMAQCQLGALGDPPPENPPCRGCTRLSGHIFPSHLRRPFHLKGSDLVEFRRSIGDMGLDELVRVEYEGLPLGELCLPSLRWTLRRHRLIEDPPTRALFRKFIFSGANLVRSVGEMLEIERPQALVVFSGVTFPEAIAREIALRRGIRAVTHEVSVRPLSAFFSHGHATAYPIEIPATFALSPQESRELDRYLSQRFQGEFTMAGIRFWPQIRGLDPTIQDKIARFRQVVTVFTNVIFDTSQIHANTVFDDMFAWLDVVLGLVEGHPDTLFVIRAHPDEMRPGKESRESVEARLKACGFSGRLNLLFIPPQDYLSSYELIQRSKFVMVYNSTIGLEATLLGTPVLCGGSSRYTRYPTVFFPETVEAFLESAKRFLAADQIDIPSEFTRQARIFTYFQYFRSSLDFSRFLMTQRTARGQVLLKPFHASDLHPDRCEETSILREGILKGRPFVYPESGT